MTYKPNFIPPIITNATTVGPTFINAAITPDVVYVQKASLVVLSEHKGKKFASVFRPSGKVIDRQSRDLYVWNGDGWEYVHKDPVKYPDPPNPPAGAVKHRIKGVDAWAMHRMSDEEICQLRKLMPLLE